MRRFLPLALLAAPLLGGCGNNDMTQAEIDKAKSAKFDDAARAKVAAGMAAGAQAQKAGESAWAAKKDPAEVAKINAERAAMAAPRWAEGRRSTPEATRPPGTTNASAKP